MHLHVSTISMLALLLGLTPPASFETRDSSELEPTTHATRQIRWPRRTIEVALSNSLQSPGANIKPGSDVVGAARRALARWSTIGNISFVVSWSSAQSISPPEAGDGISLLTVADTPENESFNADSTTGRTRVFYDPDTGEIAEADISINPKPRSEEGADLQFSTDGTPGTYDLEATFTHEIGHLLGLDHSAMLGSTMQGRQAFNGTYGLPAITERTLSEDDRQRMRAIYGGKQRLGKIEGRLVDSQTPGRLTPLSSVTVWAESVVTGRVVASDKTDDEGNYRLDGLPAGQYRVLAASLTDANANAPKQLRSIELSNQLPVRVGTVTPLNYNVIPIQTATPSLSPQLIGLNGDLSAVALPLEPGKRVKVYLSGAGIDQVPGSSISVNSPFFAVDPTSLVREQIAAPFPVISFEMDVAPNAPFGDYSIRLQANSGEIAFIPGALTIDPGAASSVLNPIDDAKFLISQQYTDLFARDPERAVIDRFATDISQCASHSDCLKARRIDLATSLLEQSDLQTSALFISSLYAASYGRRPSLSEFEKDRKVLSSDDKVAEVQLAFAQAFVQRTDFLNKYPAGMKGAEFVDTILATVRRATGVNLAASRSDLMASFDNTPSGRAKVLIRLVSRKDFVEALYNPSVVMLHYFAFLRRDPDESGFNSWVEVLRSKPLRDADAVRSVTCAFLNSTEYQLRFGMVATHSPTECAK